MVRMLTLRAFGRGHRTGELPGGWAARFRTSPASSPPRRPGQLQPVGCHTSSNLYKINIILFEVEYGDPEAKSVETVIARRYGLDGRHEPVKRKRTVGRKRCGQLALFSHQGSKTVPPARA